MFTIRKTCIYHLLLNVLYTHTFRTIRLTYVFYHMLYLRFEKHALNAWYEKHAFYQSLKSLMLTFYNPCIKIVFLKMYV